MNNTEQYYTPEVSDLFMGYECELSLNNGKTYSKYKLDLQWGL